MPRGGSKPLRGYTRVPRSRGGGYESPRGVRITEYEYRNRVAKKLGWKSAYQSDKFRRSDTWQGWLIKMGEAKVNYELDEYGKPIYIGPDITYRGEIVRDAYVVRQRELRGENLKPEGPAKEMREDELGRLLIGIGRRGQNDWWGSGDTPK